VRAVVIALGWFAFVAASALPALWSVRRALQQDSLGRYTDPRTGEYTSQLYELFFTWWLPILVPVLLLGCACLFLDWRPTSERRNDRPD
jgi:hypothetical protein